MAKSSRNGQGEYLVGKRPKMTRETRWGILSLLVLFVVGGIFLGGVENPAE